jgi:hypothetical protein
VNIGCAIAAAGLCAQAHGFSLHAGVRCGAHQRKELERLCRYITRPAIANDRQPRRYSDVSCKSEDDIHFATPPQFSHTQLWPLAAIPHNLGLLSLTGLLYWLLHYFD